MTTEIRIAVSPETLALLEMRMREGDTYDQVIRMLMVETITIPEGVTIDPGPIIELKAHDELQELRNVKVYDLLLAARALRDDMRRTVNLETLHEAKNATTGLVLKDAISVVMTTDNVLALDAAVKAVFDE